MLCPKCKFISFDNLLVCGKCQSDLTPVGQVLRGTAAKAHCQLFLSSVLRNALPESVVISDDRDEEGVVDDHADSGSIELTVDEGPPALEFDETELPHMDTFVVPVTVDEEPPALEIDEVMLSPEIDLVMPGTDDGVSQALKIDEIEFSDVRNSAPSAAEPAIEEPVLSVPVDRDLSEDVAISEDLPVSSEEVSPPDLEFREVEDVDEADVIVLEIDESDLTLESVAEDDPQSATDGQSKENPQGQMTLDLEGIDLSDLTHSPGDAPTSAQETAPEDAVNGIDFDEIMDLSLLIDETPEEVSEESEDESRSSDLAPVDLTLVDDALVELTVDSGRDVQSKKNLGQGDGLKLSMEGGEK